VKTEHFKGALLSTLVFTSLIVSATSTMLLLSVNPSTANPATMTIYPSDDTYAAELLPDNNLGTLNFLGVNGYPSEYMYSFLKFDLSYLGGAKITSATLHLYCWFVNEGQYGDSRKLGCYEVENVDWDELTVTWNNKPSMGNLLDSLYPSPEPHWENFDVTSWVENKKGQLASFGLKTTADTLGDHWRAYSKEHDGLDPYLEIHYGPLTPHDPIYINGNDNFTPANGVVGGSGTENDPYIIENWIISAENAHGIWIKNTTAHFLVRNCVVENGGWFLDGINLDNVVNGRIENNTCENNNHGIYLYNSDNNTLLYNTLAGNTWGFFVDNSNNNQIGNNTILATYSANFGSCPFLYTWNGTGMKFFGDINGPGGLGYRVDMSIYGGGIELRPPISTDYTAIDSSDLVPKDGSYILEMAEEQDEIAYFDKAELWVIDHDPGVEIYSPEAALSTTTPHLYPPVIHTVRNPIPPLSATDWKGNDVLPVIASPDGVYTEAELLTDSFITLDLGDLSNAGQIKLIYRAYTDWSPIGKVKAAQYVEVKNASGEWELVSENEHFGKPEAMPRTYIVDITDWFKTDDWHLRIHTGTSKIHVDWIAVDTSVDEPITVTVLKPTSANLYFKGPDNPGFEYFFGNFTKYGDVLPLLQEADDKFVVMRAGDSVELKFAEQPAPVRGRDFWFVTDAYFKQPFVKYLLGSKISTVDPLPFHGMSNYPYPPSESYPSDAEHLAYLSEWNTREYVEGEGAGISLPYSDNNTVFGNTIIGGPWSIGLWLTYETNTHILNNTISNTYIGILLSGSDNNIIDNNTVENNSNYGIYLDYYSDNNHIYHDNFINNAQQAYDGGANYWDNGYPSGGNYWSDYWDVDRYQGENQDIPGGDNIGDEPYLILPRWNWDRYPLTLQPPGAPENVRVYVNPISQGDRGGRVDNYIITVSNKGTSEKTYNLTIENTENWPWALDNASLTVPAGENRTTMLHVTIPSAAAVCTVNKITITVEAALNPSENDVTRCYAQRGEVDFKLGTCWLGLYQLRANFKLRVRDNSGGLRMYFYNYDNVQENASLPPAVVWSTTPYYLDNDVMGVIYTPHVGGLGVKKAKLFLVDTENNVISKVKGWVTIRTDLWELLMEIRGKWPYASSGERDNLWKELMSIRGQWPNAPTTRDPVWIED